MGKYFKYAIGEILLVVIGILIALQINNWNENRKKSQEVGMGLFELKNNLIADSLAIKKVGNAISQDLRYQQELIDKIESKEVLDSSFNGHLGRVIIMRRINFLKNGYDILRNLGLERIKNTELRNAITAYYDDILYQLLKDIEDDEDEFKDVLIPYVRKHFTDWKFGSYGIPKSYEQLRYDDEFKITLQINYLNRQSTMDRLKAATIKLKEIINLIDTYRQDD